MIRALVVGILMSLPLAASAQPVPPGLRIAPVRLQIKSNAQQAGFLGQGSKERLTIKTLEKAQVGKPGQVEASIRGVGGMTGMQKNVVLATAKFKVTQSIEGQMASPEQQGGQVWQRRLFLTAAGR
jgi:hypothetical protein